MLQHDPRHLARVTRLAAPPLGQLRRHDGAHQLHAPVLVPVRGAQRAVRHALEVVGQLLADDGLVRDDEARGARVQTQRVVGLLPELAGQGRFVVDLGVWGGVVVRGAGADAYAVLAGVGGSAAVVAAGAVGCGAPAEAVLEGRIAPTGLSGVGAVAVVLVVMVVVVVQVAVVRVVDVVAAPDAAHDALEEAGMLRPGGLDLRLAHSEAMM